MTMADDEDVDIMGNCDDIGQLLSCEYTVHPKWINEYEEGGNFWSDSVPKHDDLERNVKVLHSEEIAIETPNVTAPVTDWPCESTEAMNADYIIFDDDIPAAIEEVVENNAYTQCDVDNIDDDKKSGEIFFLEPAAFETHPAPKNLKYIGPRSARSILKVQLGTSSAKNEGKTASKFKSTLTIQPKYVKIDKIVKFENEPQEQKKAPKFKESFKIPRTNSSNDMLLKKREKHIRRNSVSKKSGGKSHKKKNIANDFGENITIIHDADTTTNNEWKPMESTPNIATNSDSDIEIDIESDIVDSPPMTPKDSTYSMASSSKFSSSVIQKRLKKSDKLKIQNLKISQALEQELSDTSIPTAEVLVDYNQISDLEKHIHCEFFDGRPTKSADQYLRIRNHIIDVWKTIKPTYVSKTAVRSGLKHGGDVNCISRIHRLLEQIGAINFGFQGKYFEYVRPLSEYMTMFVQIPRNRANINSQLEIVSYKERSQRRKQSYNLLKQHGPMNIKTPIITPLEKDLEMVKCIKIHSKENSLLKIVINLSTLLCIQLHAISSRNEVMGFVGGLRTVIDGKEIIHLKCYKACRTTEQSERSCEMCPISQLEASSILESEGFELLAWFHSHPKFAADPSRRDVRTQQGMQLQFSKIIGIIFSCLDMSLKCFRLLPSDLESDGDVTPFDVTVNVTKERSKLKYDIRNVLSAIGGKNDVLVDKLIKSSEAILNKLGLTSDLIFRDIL